MGQARLGEKQFFCQLFILNPFCVVIVAVIIDDDGS